MSLKLLLLLAIHGMSVPRQAEFLQVEAPLSPHKVAQYDAAVDLWQQLRVQLDLALQLAGNSNRDVWKMFWAAQQRFFKLLCIGLKLDTVIAEVGGPQNSVCLPPYLREAGVALVTATPMCGRCHGQQSRQLLCSGFELDAVNQEQGTQVLVTLTVNFVLCLVLRTTEMWK